MNIAIIVAAGSGKRFGGDVPKQFIEIAGKSVLVHTLEKFQNCSAIDKIILVLSASEMEKFGNAAYEFQIDKLKSIVAGGATRAQSTAAGLNAAEAAPDDIIAVHDGARPLVTIAEIAQTINAAEKFGAACLTAKVTDTIKEVSDGKIRQTIDRENLRRALTPQCFRFEILQKSFDLVDLSETATDECFAVEKAGYEIAVVEGSADNIKITHPADLIQAEKLLEKREE